MNIDDMKIVEVYEFYDRPLLFSVRDPLGVTYLVLLVEDPDTWLYAVISPERFEALQYCVIDFHDAFLEAETVYEVRISYGEVEEQLVKQIPPAEISDDWLPDPGMFVRLGE